MDNNINPKIYIALTSIPSRMENPLFESHLQSLFSQSYPIERVILSLPQYYPRTSDKRNESLIQNWQEKYGHILYINELEKDYGPASKFIGPFLLHEQGKFNFDQAILIIVDDDHHYDSNMSLIYQEFFNSHPDIKIATGNNTIYFFANNQLKYEHMCNLTYVLNEKRHMCGFMSFAFRWTEFYIHKLLHYTLNLLKLYEDAFYHDEGILLNFILGLDLTVYYIQYLFVDRIKDEMSNALCLRHNVLFYRKQIEKTIRDFTISHHLLGDEMKYYSYRTLRGYRSLTT